MREIDEKLIEMFRRMGRLEFNHRPGSSTPFQASVVKDFRPVVVIAQSAWCATQNEAMRELRSIIIERGEDPQ